MALFNFDDDFDDLPGQTYKTKQWHKWFAWRPIKIDNKRVWLKTIYRRGYMFMLKKSLWHWEYAENEFDVLRKPPKIEIKYDGQKPPKRPPPPPAPPPPPRPPKSVF